MWEPTCQQQFAACQWSSLRHPVHQRRPHWPGQVDASPLASAERGTSVPDQGQVSIRQQLQVLRSRTKEVYKSVCKSGALWLSVTWRLSPWITVKLFKKYEKRSWRRLWVLSRVFSLRARCKVQLFQVKNLESWTSKNLAWGLDDRQKSLNKSLHSHIPTLNVELHFYWNEASSCEAWGQNQTLPTHKHMLSPNTLSSA